jgi:hypothetical protein
MAKIRTFRKPGVAVADDHPDGGTIHIYPMGAAEVGKFQDEYNALRFERNDDGSLKLGDDSKPIEIETSIEQSNKNRIAMIRKHCVFKVTNLVDAVDPTDADGNWKLIELTTDDEIEAFLGGTSMHLAEVEVKVTRWVEREIKVENIVPDRDGGEATRIIESRMALVEEPLIEGGVQKTEKRMVPANQRMFNYVFDRAQELMTSKGAEVKNSSPTPPGSSE